VLQTFAKGYIFYCTAASLNASRSTFVGHDEQRIFFVVFDILPQVIKMLFCKKKAAICVLCAKKQLHNFL